MSQLVVSECFSGQVSVLGLKCCTHYKYIVPSEGIDSLFISHCQKRFLFFLLLLFLFFWGG